MKSLQGIVVHPDYVFIKTRCSADGDRSSMVSAFLGKSASITAVDLRNWVLQVFVNLI